VDRPAPRTQHPAPSTAPSTRHPARHPAPGTQHPAPDTQVWRRNLFAITAASFMGYAGFTVVMPFLPLFIAQLGVSDVGEVAVWTGLSLGVTPGLTAMMSPFWGRLADRYGRKIMCERSLASFVVVMAATAYVTKPWHVFALRAVQGLFAGYGVLTLTMAAESAPRDRMAQAIGLVQTAQRLGPAVGPVIGGVLAGLVGLRRAFLITAGFYAVGLLLVFLLYDERVTHAQAVDAEERGRVSFRNVLAFENFILLMAVIFVIQFVDRSFGPVLPLYIAQVGFGHERVPIVAGVLFSITACTGALGHHFCGRLLKRFAARLVIAGGASVAALGAAGFAMTGSLWLMGLAATIFGVGVGASMTASYAAAGSVIPAGAHGTGFGVLTTASLTGLAVSPVVAGFLGGTIKVVFFVDVALMGLIGAVVWRTMVDGQSLTIDD
jgi:MFS transporter, DHA1 family, multidrug resistance protein